MKIDKVFRIALLCLLAYCIFLLKGIAEKTTPNGRYQSAGSGEILVTRTGKRYLEYGGTWNVVTEDGLEPVKELPK